MRFRTRLMTMAVAVLAVAPAAYGSDRDLVVLKNGDRVMGEIKNLERGRMELKTDAMSTVYVEWPHVAEITSPLTFEVETATGVRYLGQLRTEGSGRLVVDDGTSRNAIDLADVVRMHPIRSTFFSRIDGSIDVGASYTKSSGIGQGTINSDAEFRRPSFEVQANFNSTITVESDDDTTSRATLQLGYAQLLRDRWFIPGFTQFDTNSELGLDLRTTVGGGVGRYLVQSNRSAMLLAGGLVVTRENPVDGDITKSLEGFAQFGYDFFTYDTPKTDISLREMINPSLSDAGRIRLQLDADIKREIVRDFTVGMSVYHTYDNRPPTEGASTTDVGLSLSIGWTF